MYASLLNTGARTAHVAAALVAVACFAAGGFVALNHPVAPTLALAAFYAAMLASAWLPRLWLFAVPACLPFLNFLPWTGWLVVDEFDLLMLAILAGAYGRRAWSGEATKPVDATGAAPGSEAGALGVWLPAALGVAACWACAIGWLAAEPALPSWFQGYTDPLNTLRVFKSVMWAVLAVPLLRDAVRRSADVALRRIAAGMVAGLACVVLAVLYERLAFPGLFNFVGHYRITAMFWEMHVGGAAIDGYLALAVPFVAWGLLAARGPAGWVAGALLAIAATYAGLTTFARGVYLAVSAPLLLLAGLLWLQARGVDPLLLSQRFWQWLQPSTWRARAGWALAAALVLEVVGVLNGGDYMAERVAATDRDFGSRMAHWQRGLSLLETSGEWLWGRGLGRLPALYSTSFKEGELSGQVGWREMPGEDGEMRGIATVSGPASDGDLGGLLSLAQRVEVSSGQRFRVQLHARVTAPVQILVRVCERHLLYNGGCQTAYARLAPSASGWQDLALPLRGPPLSGGPWYAPRSALFTLSVLDEAASVDIGRIRLESGRGGESLVNNDFSRGLASWFPAAQTYYLPWHIDNLFVELVVERGLLGLGLTLSLVLCALWRLVLGRARHHPLAPYFAASLSGAMLVGLVSSVMDVPRVAFLLFWLACLALQLPARRVPSG